MGDYKKTHSKRFCCCKCGKLSGKVELIDDEMICNDGCYSTTGIDNRTKDGEPMWLEQKE